MRPHPYAKPSSALAFHRLIPRDPSHQVAATRLDSEMIRVDDPRVSYKLDRAQVLTTSTSPFDLAGVVSIYSCSANAGESRETHEEGISCFARLLEKCSVSM